MTAILVGFAGALAVAIVYNAARIALSERARELASLRVLGFTRGEMAGMLLGEQAVLIVGGVAVGLAARLPAVRHRRGPVPVGAVPDPARPERPDVRLRIAVIVCAAAGSALLVRRRINRLDLVAVLKTRE